MPEHRDRVAADKVLVGVELYSLPEGDTPLEAFVLIKVLDDEGSVSWRVRTTDTMGDEELLGALIVQTDLLRRQARSDWEQEDD